MASSGNCNLKVTNADADAVFTRNLQVRIHQSSKCSGRSEATSGTSLYTIPMQSVNIFHIHSLKVIST